MKKRFLSILLVLVMMVSLVPAMSSNAFAVSAGAGSRVMEGGQRDFKWPVPSSYGLSSCFKDGRNHDAIDIGGAALNANVVASYDGVVYETGYSGGYGNYVLIQHNYKLSNGGTKVLYSKYNHLNSIKVSKGQTVYRGSTVVGGVGNTGGNYPVHLDFQILTSPNWQNYNYHNVSIDPYINDLLELPSGIWVASTSDCCGVGPTGCCCYQYVQLVKSQYSKPITHTITFNANGGSCSTGSVKVSHGGSISNPPTASRSGYTFDGWYTSASGGTWISPTFTFESDATVYAHWKVNRVAVSLCYPDGLGWRYVPVDVGGEYTLPSDYPKASGKYFCGWSYTFGASSYDLRPGDKITVTKDIELYPVYVSHEKATSGSEVYIYNINDFDAAGYNVQTVRHAKETKIDKSYWTSWSDYSLEPVSASPTVEVRTAKMYRYYYFLCPYCGRHEPFYGTSDCGKKIPSSAWHEKWSTTPYSQVSSSTFSYASYKSYTYSLDGELWCFSTGNKNDTAIGSIDANGAASVIEKGYSYREYITKYDTQTTYINSYIITRADGGEESGSGSLGGTSSGFGGFFGNIGNMFKNFFAKIFFFLPFC